jgi:hypothetical protein
MTATGLLAVAELNLRVAWAAILAGGVTGALLGMFFHRDDWLGGYASWPRRITRLGHIAFFGIALLNVAFAVTARSLAWEARPAIVIASLSLVAANVLMPAVCFLSAWKKGFRHLFFIPVGCVLLPAAIVVWRLLP